jgi:hypothetical protein
MTLYKTAVSHNTSQNSKNASHEQHPSRTTVTGNDAFAGTGKQQNQNLDSSLDIGFKNSVEPQELIIAGHGVRRTPLLVEVILLILLAQHIDSSENVDHTHDADKFVVVVLPLHSLDLFSFSSDILLLPLLRCAFVALRCGLKLCSNEDRIFRA